MTDQDLQKFLPCFGLVYAFGPDEISLIASPELQDEDDVATLVSIVAISAMKFQEQDVGVWLWSADPDLDAVRQHLTSGGTFKDLPQALARLRFSVITVNSSTVAEA